MDFYAIPPNKHLDLMHYGDRYFCLAHFYKEDTAYRQYFLTLRAQQPESFITLDNAAAERSLVEEADLLDIVAELKPNEVIAPDYLLDKKKTLASLYSFAEAMKARGLDQHTNLFACPQADNAEDWFAVFGEMSRHPQVKTLGLSKITVPYCFANQSTGDVNIAKARQKAVQGLHDRGLLIKDIHLLGMGEADEYEYYAHMIKMQDAKDVAQHLRSSDSCYSILAATHGIRFQQGNFTRVPTTEEYYHCQLTREQFFDAKNNIRYLKQMYGHLERASSRYIPWDSTQEYEGH